MRQKWICEDCFSVFHFQKYLQKHKKICKDRNQEIEKFDCNLCEKQFLTNHYLKKHVQYAHEGVRRHICKICQHGFISKNDVRKHKQSVHITVSFVESFKDSIIILPSLRSRNFPVISAKILTSH